MKNITGKTLIFYTFQGRNSKEQNVTTFKKSVPQEPKIRDVLYELPLDYKKNSYHFRFKSEFFEGDQKLVSWIDISNLLAKVPILNNSIFVKILTLPSDSANKLFNRDKLRAIGLIDPLPNGSQKSAPTPRPPPTPTVNQRPPSEVVVEKPAPRVKSDENIFDMDGGEKSTPVRVFVPGQETTAERLKGFQDSFNEEEQARENELIAEKQSEQKLLEWGYSGHKTINNLTTLLATLHVIWPEWQQVSLTDMLKPEDVNALFKKAVVKVHPDKNRRKDFRTKYLAKRVFELLNEAKKAQKE